MVLWRVEVLGACVRMNLCKFEWRSAKLCMLGVVSFLVQLIWGHVLSPLMGGSAYVNVMSGVFCPSTTPRAATSASSLCLTPVCDLTLPISHIYTISHIVPCADDVVR